MISHPKIVTSTRVLLPANGAKVVWHLNIFLWVSRDAWGANAASALILQSRWVRSQLCTLGHILVFTRFYRDSIGVAAGGGRGMWTLVTAMVGRRYHGRGQRTRGRDGRSARGGRGCKLQGQLWSDSAILGRGPRARGCGEAPAGGGRGCRLQGYLWLDTTYGLHSLDMWL